MIRRISISNFILIKKAELGFNSGFSAITGETGAGKSIFLNALNAVFGSRIDPKWLRNPNEKSIVEVYFESAQKSLIEFLEHKDLDVELPTIIRREILPNGKSRAFINDSPVNASTLKEFGNLFVEMHQQGEAPQLLEPAYQTELIDVFCGNSDLYQRYKENYRKLKILKKQLKSKQENFDNLQKEQDFLKFQLSEIEELNLDTWNVNESLDRLQIMENQEKLANLLSASLQALEGEEFNAIDFLKQAAQQISMAAKIASTYENINNRIQSALLELEDIQTEINSLAQSSDFDENFSTEIQERIDAYNKILFKHRLNSLEELLVLRDELSAKIEGTHDLEKELLQIRKDLELLEKDCFLLANELDKTRTAKKDGIKQLLEETFKELGLKEASIAIEVKKQENLGEFGLSQCEILFKANKSGGFETLKKAASGGELSRVLLTLKYHLSNFGKQEVLILDEIDAGISGEIAQKVGRIMHTLSKKVQVLAVTHLPQVAAEADFHYQIIKQHGTDETTSSIELMDNENRVLALAKMLSGEKISEAAMQNAKELLASN